MKTQLLKLLTVCFIISILISPALLIWWRIWYYHNEFMTAQQVFQLDNRTDLNSVALLSTEALKQAFRPVSSVITNSVFLGFLISIPLGFWVGLLLSDRYQTRRHTTLREQVATLEKLWQQSIY
jgi:hypothetical protein